LPRIASRRGPTVKENLVAILPVCPPGSDVTDTEPQKVWAVRVAATYFIEHGVQRAPYKDRRHLIKIEDSEVFYP
jgi:hypothetical protein